MVPRNSAMRGGVEKNCSLRPPSEILTRYAATAPAAGRCARACTRVHTYMHVCVHRNSYTRYQYTAKKTSRMQCTGTFFYLLRLCPVARHECK